jgi:hypothetical protein
VFRGAFCSQVSDATTLMSSKAKTKSPPPIGTAEAEEQP